jgi:hypothetical protein
MVIYINDSISILIVFPFCVKEKFTIYSLNSLQLIVDLVASWNNLLNWSENAAKARRLQEEIIVQKQLLDSFDVDNEWVLNSEEAIREKIHELNVSFCLMLSPSFYAWLSFAKFG